VTTPPPDVTTPPADVITPPPDVTLDKMTPTDGRGYDADSGASPDGPRDGTITPDIQEAGPVDVTPPNVDADGCTLNPCGGCAELTGTPGAACGLCGTFACNADKNSLNCDNDPGLNACNGCGTLSGAPGAACGSCGTFACSADKASVNCNNDLGINACGGCGVLAGAPGAKCLTCGVYACSADKSSVVCDHPDPLTVKQVAAGDSVTCVLLTTGGIRCWGRNDEGELGDGTTVSQSVPPAVNIASDVSDFTAIAVSGSYSCALRSGGGVRCWGVNADGELGTGTTTPIPNLIGTDVLGGVTGITATATTSCALLATGTVRCWGYGATGELGDGTTDSRPTPNVPVVGLTGGVAVSGTCAQLNTGGMSCWGGNGSGSLGDGTGVDSSVPVNVLGLSHVSAIGAGSSHTCAIDSGGVFCWGFNAFGQCGDGRLTRQVYQPGSMSVQTDAKSVGVGGFHTCALLNTGRVRCWGENSAGTVGDGTTTDSLVPVDVVGLSGVASLSVGPEHNCALLDSGAVRCWGANWYGQLGDGTLEVRTTPVDVPWICP
jgi:alpha-tubulin suppressor-like RCC1 family protein